MTKKVYTFKTTSSDTLLGELHGIDEKREVLHISYPVKIMLVPTLTEQGLMTQFVPSLYQPFGVTSVIPLNMDFMVSVMPCSDFDERYYYSVLADLMYSETKRLIFTDKFLYEKEYADKFIMSTHATIQ